MTTNYFSLAGGDFFQDWSDAAAISADDNWAAVASIVGYRGDGVVSGTGKDPRTATGTSTVVDVNANRGDPNTFATGGVTEFDGLPDRVVGLQGSGTANAPYLAFYLDATGRENITFSVQLRDIDSGTGTRPPIQPVAIQYRLGDSGAWANVPGEMSRNANTGGDTSLSVTLPPDANGQAQLQVRVITTDAVGTDNFIGVDDIKVHSDPIVVVVEHHGTLSIDDASVTEGNSGTAAMTFTVNRTAGSDGAVSASWTINLAGTAGAGDLAPGHVLTGTVNFADGQTTATITVQIAGDIEYRAERDVHR